MDHKPEPSKAREEAQTIMNMQRAYKKFRKAVKPVPFGKAIPRGIRIFTKPTVRKPDTKLEEP